MKTESYFKEYNQFVIDQQKAIQELEQERNALESKIKIDKSTYKQLIMDGQEMIKQITYIKQQMLMKRN